MWSFDAIYTPDDLAEQMVRVVDRAPSAIADFACGDGGLLRAAAKRWPKSNLIATDISNPALEQLRKRRFVQYLGCCDFLSIRSRSRCNPLRKWAGGIDLVLLNPPFTCRGGTRLRVTTPSFNLHCGTAMAFLLTAFEYLGSTGEIVAIIPAGSVTAEKDQKAWAALRLHSKVAFISEHDHRTFGVCDPTTTIVHISKKTNKSEVPAHPELQSPCACCANELSSHPITLYRGTIQMHAIPPGATPLAHSTDLRDFRLVLNGHRADPGASALRGPFVALSRVGNPMKEKIALHYSNQRIGISDCIVALRCKTKEQASQLHSSLLDQWPLVKNLYGGTGAKYITVSRLVRLLSELGFSVIPHANAKHQLKRSIG